MKSEKTIAFISYFYLIGLLIAYLNNTQKKSSFVSFHIRQSLGLWISFFILAYPVGSFDSWNVTLSFWICFTVLIVYGFSTVLSGKTIPIPLVGRFYQNIFKNIH